MACATLRYHDSNRIAIFSINIGVENANTKGNTAVLTARASFPPRNTLRY
jgi:hypothetical protein